MDRSPLPGPGRTSSHFRRWGAVWLLVALFAASWVGQALAMAPTIQEQGWREFWAATFENWQSEWAQLAVQAVFLGAAKHWIFQADAADLERIEGKITALAPRLDDAQTLGAVDDAVQRVLDSDPMTVNMGALRFAEELRDLMRGTR